MLDFFRTTTSNLLAAEAATGVGHHVAVSIVGADDLPDSGYLRAKVAQEGLIESGGIPYTIVRSTQFFEFLRPIADSTTEGDVVRATPAKFQPIAADDVAAFVTEAALAEPVNGRIEIAGPRRSASTSCCAPSWNPTATPARSSRTRTPATSAPSPPTPRSCPPARLASARPGWRTGSRRPEVAFPRCQATLTA